MKHAITALAAAVLPLSAAVAVPSSHPVQTVRLGQPIRVGATQVVPLAVIEDSRCPATVSCVWAGRVVVRLGLVSQTGKLTRRIALHESLTIGHQVVTLENVTPARTIAGVLPGAYRFGFTVRPAPVRQLSRPDVA